MMMLAARRNLFSTQGITSTKTDQPMDWPTDTTCMFILSSPGSGSSTIRELVSQCKVADNRHCMISGENRGAFKYLTRFHSNVAYAYREGINEKTEKGAWRNYFDPEQVEKATADLVASMLNPSRSACWGFKDILHGREPLPGEPLMLANEIEFLASLCSDPKIIIHTRKDPKAEFNSSVLKNRHGEQLITLKQHSCFDSYTGLLEGNKTLDGCVAKKSSPIVFRHYLEDYLGNTENYGALWSYLGCTNTRPEAGQISKTDQ